MPFCRNITINIQCQSPSEHKDGMFYYCKKHHEEALQNNALYKETAEQWNISTDVLAHAYEAFDQAAQENYATAHSIGQMQEAELRGEVIHPAEKDMLFRRRFDAMDRFVYLRDVYNELSRAKQERDQLNTRLTERIRRNIPDTIRQMDEDFRATRRRIQHFIEPQQATIQRDPPGSIDLRGFANDSQNVHRESVVTSTHDIIRYILEIPNSTLSEIKRVLQSSNYADIREIVLTELTKDYTTVHAFDQSYANVLDHVWSFIRCHEHRDSLIQRLCEEVVSGKDMCHSGKMSRLTNILLGFDDSIRVLSMDEFKLRIAHLMNRPLNERESVARELFEEFHIAQAEREAWLNPLLET